jgi:hypothetical protein
MLPGLRYWFRGAVMVAQRAMSPNYVGIGLAIATGLAVNLGSSLQAQAQDLSLLNLQTQLSIQTPPISAQMPNANAAPKSSQTEFLLTSGKTVCVPTPLVERVKAAAASRYNKNKNGVTTEDIKSVIQEILNDQESPDTSRRISAKALAAAIKINPGCLTQQPVTVTISFPFNPTYESNILKSGNNSSPGESAGFGGNALIATGVKDRPWDLVAFGGGEASARYTPKSSPSFDNLTSQAAYQMFLYAYGYNPDTKSPANNLVPGSPNLPPPGMITFETLTFGYQNQTAFAPTFKAEKADLMTPQAIYSIQNISLDDPNSKPCGAVSNGPNGTVIDSRSFCHYANFSITAGQTFSDVKTLQNVNFAASATLGWNITPALSLTLPATATAKSFEDVIGGRRDLLLQAGPVLSYSSTLDALCPPKSVRDEFNYCYDEHPRFTFSLPVTYYRNYSTLSTAAWSGWVIMPTLTIAFVYSPTSHQTQ